MSKDLLFKRVFKERCPISNKPFDKGVETIMLDYNEAKLRVIKKYVRFGNEKKKS